MSDDSDDSESFENILDEVLEGFVEDNPQVYKKLIEYFHDYEDPMINAALIDILSILDRTTVDGFLERYSDLEKKLAGNIRKDKIEKAAKIRSAANTYVDAVYQAREIVEFGEFQEDGGIEFDFGYDDEGGNGETN